jgi:hypothetical protein
VQNARPAAGEDQGMGPALGHRGHDGQKLGTHGGIDAVQPLGPIQRQTGNAVAPFLQYGIHKRLM